MNFIDFKTSARWDKLPMKRVSRFGYFVVRQIKDYIYPSKTYIWYLMVVNGMTLPCH